MLDIWERDNNHRHQYQDIHVGKAIIIPTIDSHKGIKECVSRFCYKNQKWYHVVANYECKEAYVDLGRQKLGLLARLLTPYTFIVAQIR